MLREIRSESEGRLSQRGKAEVHVGCVEHPRSCAKLPPRTFIKKSERAVSRVLCPGCPGDGHLSGPSIARRHERPTRKSRTGRPYPLAGDASLCGLAPGGVFQVLPVTRESGGFLPHRFTLTPARGGFLFCGTIHGVAPCPVSGPPCPAELGLSSPRCRRAIISPTLIP